MSVRANKCIFYHDVGSVMSACHLKGSPMPCKMALNQICRDYCLKSQIEKIKERKH